MITLILITPIHVGAKLPKLLIIFRWQNNRKKAHSFNIIFSGNMKILKVYKSQFRKNENPETKAFSISGFDIRLQRYCKGVLSYHSCHLEAFVCHFPVVFGGESFMVDEVHNRADKAKTDSEKV